VSATPVAAPVGRPVSGPSALGGDFRRFLALTVTLAQTEFKLRFFGSVLGYLWQLVRPFLLFGVLYVVFTEFVRIGGEAKFYAVVLVMGIVLFQFVAEATNGAVTSVINRENLVRKIHFPRMVIPASVVLTAAMYLVFNLVAVFVFALIAGVSVHASWVQLPVLLLALAVGTLGVAMLVSALYVRFRDVQPIWEVTLQVLFYASPVLYPIEVVPSLALQKVILLANPFAAILQQVRHAIIDPTAPSTADILGGLHWLLVPAAFIAGLFVLGFWVFNREAPRIAEEL